MKTRLGDTFEKIAARIFGDSNLADLVRRANPKIADVEDIPAGIDIINPRSRIAAPAPIAADDDTQIAVRLKGRDFSSWTSLSVTQNIGAVSTFSITAPFDEDDFIFREVFRPFEFIPCEIFVGGQPFFAGTMVEISPNKSGQGRTVSAGGYAVSGVLGDVQAPVSLYPVEFENQNLQQITSVLVAPFGVDVSFSESPGPVFEQVALDPDKTIMNFLVDLARERGFLITSDALGGLFYHKPPASGSPVADITGAAVVVQSDFRAQQVFSSITALGDTAIGGGAELYTAENELLSTVLRPLVFQTSDSVDADVKGAATAKLGRMYGAAMSLTVSMPTWYDPTGDLWQVNTFLNFEDAGAMIYEKTKFLVKGIQFSRGPGGDKADLTLSLPGAYTDAPPGEFPWA